MKKSLLLLLSLINIGLHAQATVGVITKTEEALDGYVFFSPFSSTKAYLVDNCGNLINEWDRGTRPGLSAYFLDNGLMMRTYKIDPVGPFTSASNAGGIELVDWDNNVVWQYTINTSEQLSHHDAVMMPNGNILILTWELTYRDELVALGRNPNEIAPENYMWSEKILELKPIDTDSAELVWQWNINDHYIQDLDSTKMGYGIVANHPELFDINQPSLNSGNSNESRDWNHFNAIDYNPTLDQILISVRNSDEIWILDHSTTTAEAAGHTGGRYGKGGDILYRWGNPSAYKLAPPDQQMLWGQHGVNWVTTGLQDAGSIMIFNNGNGKPGQDFTQIQLLNLPHADDGFYTRTESEPYGPATATVIYGDEPSERFYSPYLSNAQRLSNDNTLINSGSPGRIFEITPDRMIAWEYEIPLFGDTPASQGQNVNGNSNFRAYKYPADYLGLMGKDLTPGEPIELNPLDCDLVSSSRELAQEEVTIHYNSALQTILIDGHTREKQVILSDLDGKIILRATYEEGGIRLGDISLSGIYTVTLITKNQRRLARKIFIN